MPHDVQRRPSGSTPKVAFDQRTHDVQQRKLIAGPGIRITRTSRGDVVTYAGPQKKNKGSTDWYLGEYDEILSYAAQKVVTRGVLGEFICVQSVPAGVPPETGAPYWHAWGSPAPGVWQ